MNAKNGNLVGRLTRHTLPVWALCAFLATPASAQNDEQRVEVSDYGTVTLAVQDTDLAQVLEMLSIQSQKNIITSKNVSATISANLYDVTFYEALENILKVNGYSYIEEGNFIYIYTEEEIKTLEEARRKTESRIFELENLSASDANELIAPLLSEKGQSSFRGDVDPGIEADASDVGEDGWAFTAMLVVNDYPENLEQISNLLLQLDKAPKQVLIESTILQTTLDESNAFGIDFSVLGNLDFTDLTNPLSAVNNLINGADPTNGFQPADNAAAAGASTVGNTNGAGGLKIGVLKDEIAVFLKVLDEVTDATVLARPKIMCLNRQRAEVLVGARVGYLSTTATETTTTQTVEFLDTGIHLMFRPFISSSGMVRLELAPSVSEASLRTVTDAQGLSVTIPDELTNEITTNVRVQDGNTLVLGGLFRESNRYTRRQVPVLGDIPIIGAAFRGQDDTVDRDEIVFLITPTILHDEALWAAGDKVHDFVDEVVVGARAGLLPFSRTRQTESLNNRAVAAFNEGDLDQALYYVNNSLRLAPNQPELLRFRARILGAGEKPFERGILHRDLAPLIRGTAMLEGDGTRHATDGWQTSNTTSWRTVPPVEPVVPVTPFEVTASVDDAWENEAAESFETTADDGNDWNENPEDPWDTNIDETVGEADTFDPGSSVSNQPVAPTEFEVVTFDSNDAAAGVTGTVAVMPSTPVTVEGASGSIAVLPAPSPSSTPTTVAAGTELPATVFSQAENERFIDLFIHEYFASLGIEDLSPFGEMATANDEAELPFSTFDDMIETDVAGVSESSDPRDD